MDSKKYVLLTAARDEESYIGKCIESVLNQTVKPAEWVIVDDGSRDSTLGIVKSFSKETKLIAPYSVENISDRNFGSKATAVNFAYKQIQSTDHEFVGVLDADVSFESDYYEKIMEKMNADPSIGIGGGREIDFSKGTYTMTYNSIFWSVYGPVQFFRRECFEQIGGYMALPCGGIDAVAEVMARMNGWKVRTFTDIQFLHHRSPCSGNSSVYKTNFKIGIREYAYGTHPLFQVAKVITRIKEKPVIGGAFMRLFGFMYAYLGKKEIDVSSDVRKYLRKEQMKRLITMDNSK